MIAIADKYKQIISARPLYKLSAYVYKYGKTPNADDVLGTNADFELQEDDFYYTGNSIRAESNSFPVGNAVCKTCTLTLCPSDNYGAADFAGAHLVLKITAVTDGSLFTVTGDYYFVQTVSVENGKIVLECSDLMSRADKQYKYDVEFTSNAGYSTTQIYSVFTSVLTQMGVTYPVTPDVSPDSNGLVNVANLNMFSTYSYDTHLRLQNSEYTCRQMLDFIGMATLSNIIVDAGGLGIKPNPLFYARTVDGVQEYVFSGHSLKNAWSEFSSEAEEVKVTGVECTVKTDTSGRDTEPVTYKSDTYTGKYVLDVSDNPFFMDGTRLNTLMGFISAVTPQKFSGRFMGYPLIEYGDYIDAVHQDGELKSFVTDFEWSISGAVTVGCSVETATENSLVYTGGASAAIVSNQDVLDAITADDTSAWSSAAEKAGATADYIVARGKTGIWQWEKYASGVAKCWGVYSGSNINAAKNHYMGWYYSDPIAVVLPFEFTTVPTVVVSGGGYNNLTVARTASSTTTSAGVWILALDQYATAVSVSVDIMVNGSWK